MPCWYHWASETGQYDLKDFFFPFLPFEGKVFSLSVCQQLLPTEQGFSMKLLLSENVSQVLKAVKGCTVVYCWFPNAVGFFGGSGKTALNQQPNSPLVPACDVAEHCDVSFCRLPDVLELLVHCTGAS